MELDAVMLARIQFGFTDCVPHHLSRAFTIGLSAWIATLEGIWLKTGDERYHVLARFWTKIFAVSFAMGVVSGIVHLLPVRHQLEWLQREWSATWLRRSSAMRC